MKLKINIVDAFTSALFKGNSAAVIITEQWLSDALMQSIAIENNLSETAFLVANSADEFAIRWFSPITEIDFCGHASLAAAFVIFANNPEFEQITFTTKSVGALTVTQAADGFIQMNFPKRAPKPVVDVPADLLSGLSITPDEVLLSPQAYFAVYGSAQSVLDVTQNKECLKKLAPYDVVVTAPSNSQPYDFISRYFWPANGGDEDPVTGSIHAGLAPYWSQKLGKTQLTALQASKRGGVLSCRVEKDRVYISGQAIQYLEGYITV